METRLLSAASLIEAQAVIAGRTRADPIGLLDVLVRDLDLEIAALTATQAEIVGDDDHHTDATVVRLPVVGGGSSPG